MSISALGSGLSGMQAFQRALDVTGNNVANVDTNGFQPQQATFQDVASGGVSVTATTPGATASGTASPTSPSSASGSLTAPQGLSATPSGTDLVAETVNSLQYKYGFDLSAQVVKTADETLGTLINIQA
jgi:flagellar basal-body rod protein FlgC